MTGYGGYFLQGMASGMQSGFEMGWKKKQQKKLEEEEKKIIEGTTLFNNQIKLYGEDKIYTDDEVAMINTAWLAAGAEVQERTKGTRDAIQTMNKGQVEQDFQWLELVSTWTDGLDPKNAKEIFDSIRPNITSKRGKDFYTAYEKMYEAKYKAAQNQPTPEVFTSPSGVQDTYPEAGYEYNKDLGGYVPTYQKPPTPEKPTDIQVKLAEVDKLTFLTEERRNAMKVNILSGSDSATAEKVNAIKAAGGTNADILESLGAGVVGVNPPKATEGTETVTTLKSWEEMFDIKDEKGPKTEDQYNRALELLAQSGDKYKPKYASWKEALIAEVKIIGQELKGITNKTDYNLLLKVYLQKLEEIKAKYPDVDLSQFPEFKQQSFWKKLLERGKYFK